MDRILNEKSLHMSTADFESDAYQYIAINKCNPSNS